MDIITANYGTDNIAILLGYGNGTFSSVQTYSTGVFSRPLSVLAADFNNDNLVDIVVTNFGTNSIGIFLGHGNATFSNQMVISTGTSRPVTIAIGDFNADGKMDIIVVNYGTDSFDIFLGFCNGTFEVFTRYSTGYDSDPWSIAVGHLNNDTKLDVVVANHGTNNIGIFFGYGNGTFTDQILYSTGSASSPCAVAIADFNNDNLLDIVVANSGTDNIGIFFGYGNGTFRKQITFPTGTASGPRSVIAGDLNRDNIVDIAVSNYDKNMVGIFLGYGNESFSTQQTYSTGFNSRPLSIMLKDFNNDGLLDIAVANELTNAVGILMAQKSLSFNTRIFYFITQTNKRLSRSVTNIYDDDQVTLLRSYNHKKNVDTSLRSNGILTARKRLPRFTYLMDSYTVTIGDLNNDNQLDMIVVYNLKAHFYVFLGYGNGSITLSFDFYSDSIMSLYAAAIGDFNGDNKMDLVVTEDAGTSVHFFKGYGNGSFSYYGNYTTNMNYLSQLVVVNDFNNDTIADIIVAYSWGSSIGVFLGYGNGTFANPVMYSFGSDPKINSMAIGDFNNDKILDIAIVNSGTHTLGIFIGHGDGSFLGQVTYSTGYRSYPVSVSIADFNGDNSMDIVVANYGSVEGAVVVVDDTKTFAVGVLLNTGDGTFTSVVLYSTGYKSAPRSVVTGDFNNDNKIDIAVANSNTGNLGVFLGNGDGSFTNQIIYAQSSNFTPNNLAVGDFNNDGVVDIAATNSYDFSVIIFLALDTVTFKNVTSIQTAKSHHPYSLVIADFNHDKKLDIALSNPSNNDVSLIFGNGSMNFSAEEYISTGDNSYPRFITSVDINRDNVLDIIVTNAGSNNVGIFYGYGNGSFQGQMIYSTGSNAQPFSVAVGDFNNDNRLDIAATNHGIHSISLLFGLDTGKLEAHVIFSNLVDHTIYRIATGDFNNDNHIDIVVVNYVTSAIDILLGSANGTLTKIISYKNPGYPSSVAVGDFNQDRNIDFAVANEGSLTMIGAEIILIYLGFGNGTFVESQIYFTGTRSYPCSVIVADINHDNALDIIFVNSGINNAAVLLGYGNGSFTDQNTYPTGDSSSPSSIAIADFNNDSHIDIVVSNNGTQTVGILLGFGNGSFDHPMTYSTGEGSGPRSIAVGDFNNDNKIDIVVANSGSNTIGVFLGYGNGSFTDQIIYYTSNNSNPQFVTVADLNNDSWMDVIVANRQTMNIDLFLGLGNGLLSAPKSFSTNSIYYPSSVIVLDLNRDNRLDMLVVDSGNIFACIGYPDDDFISGMTLSTGNGSFPGLLTVADFNNDQKLDIAVANSGSDGIGIFLGYGNGTFTSQIVYPMDFKSEPYVVVSDDLNNDKKMDIVVANYGTHSISILLGYGNGTFFIYRLYSTGLMSYPSSVGLSDLNADNYLDIVVCNSGLSELLILYGTGNGTFVNTRKISLGYGANPIQLALSDMNNDNSTDIIVINDGFKNVEIFSSACW